MQLWERGLVDLDAPANDYLRPYKLILGRDGMASGDGAASADPHRRDSRRALPGRSAPSVVGAFRWPSSSSQRGGRATVAVAGRVLPERSSGWRSPAPPLPTAITASPPWVRSSRTSAVSRSTATSAGTSSSPRDDGNRPAQIRTGGGPSRQGILGRGGAEEVTDREWIGQAGGGVYPRAATWLAMSPRHCWAGAATSTVPVLRSSTLATMFEPHLPHPRCPVWVSGSSVTTPMAIVSSGTRGYCPDSTRNPRGPR